MLGVACTVILYPWYIDRNIEAKKSIVSSNKSKETLSQNNTKPIPVKSESRPDITEKDMSNTSKGVDDMSAAHVNTNRESTPPVLLQKSTTPATLIVSSEPTSAQVSL